MKTYSLTFLFSFVLLLFLAQSCGESHSGGAEHGHDHNEESHDHGDNGEREIPAVKLNNGEKWQMNDQVTEGALELLSQIEMYQLNGAPTLESYDELGFALNEAVQTMKKNVNSDGDDANNLHYFLLRMEPQIQVLQEGTEVERNKAAGWLINYIPTYYDYFQ